jgi:hypothetical protein
MFIFFYCECGPPHTGESFEGHIIAIAGKVNVL